MAYTKKDLPNSQIQFDITLSDKEWNEFEKQSIQRLGQTTQIKGFRDGKAPESAIRTEVGEEAIIKETRDRALTLAWAEILEKETIRPIDYPAINMGKETEETKLSATFVVDVWPQINAPDFSKVSVKKTDTAASDSEIDGSINWVLKSRASHVTVSRAAKKGDRVEIDFEIDPGAKERKPEHSSKNHPLVLGEASLPKEIEDILVGMKAGESRSLTVDIPDSKKGGPPAGGKKTPIDVTLQLVQEVTLPELNDEFVSSLGGYKSVDEFRSSVRQQIETDKAKRQRMIDERSILEELSKKVKTDTPPILIDRHYKWLEHSFTHELTRMGIDREAYLKQQKLTEEKLVKSWKDEAKKRGLQDVIIDAVARENSIEPDPTELEQNMNSNKQMLIQEGTEEKNIDAYKLAEYTKEQLTRKKVIDFLLEQCIT